MSLCLRLVVLLVVSLAIFSPEAVIAEQCDYKLYSISLKDTLLKNKYKVRAFFLGNADVTRIPKIPRGWRYGFHDQLSYGLIASACSDKYAVSIDYFKDFLTIVYAPEHPDEKLYLNTKLIYIKPNGTSEIMVLHTKDFVLKEIHKCLKEN
ncbi:MAG: hypothetical protein HQK99_06070 [Nitrospirae bacterium]|nr:hypothetical protein [Nitrospirota bacterium]